MSEPIRWLQWSVPESWDQLSVTLTAWEPTLRLLRGEGWERLYDPDGTLYAICVQGNATVSSHKRAQVIGPGDVVVVPPGIGFEVEPATRFLGIVSYGPIPYHFRERFYQLWGFEHFPAQAGLGREQAYHRIAVEIIDLERAQARTPRLEVETGPWEVDLLAALDAPTNFLGAGGPGTLLEGGETLVCVAPGHRYELKACESNRTGDNRRRVVRVTLWPDFEQESRLARQFAVGARPPSPEAAIPGRPTM